MFIKIEPDKYKLYFNAFRFIFMSSDCDLCCKMAINKKYLFLYLRREPQKDEEDGV